MRGEIVNKTKDGRLINIDSSANPVFNKRGEVTGFLAIQRDITDKEQAQEQLEQERNKAQKYLDVAGVTMVIVDRDQRVSLINKKGCQVLGCQFTDNDECEIIGKNWFDRVIPETDRERLRDFFVKVMNGEKDLTEYFENMVLTKSGEERVMAWHNVVLRDHEGRPAGVLGSGEDITERKEAEKALEQTIEELEAFAYTAAHDLKAPLVTIQGFAAVLKQDLQHNRTDRVEEDVRLIDTGISKMIRLLNTVLEYGRTSRLPKPTEEIAFGEIVQDSLEQVAEQVRSSSAKVSVAPSFPEVIADRVSLVQALNNLIVNAIQYRDKSRPLVIDIGYRTADDEVVFYIRDNGSGISPGEQEKVFEAFYRGSNASEGTGLGLKIVKRVIERHGGRIWLESEIGKGTTVYFTLAGRKTEK